MSVPHIRNRQEARLDHEEYGFGVTGSVTFLYTNDGGREVTEARVSITRQAKDADGVTEFYGEGLAIAHPNDEYDVEIGQEIAFLRALRVAARDAEEYVIERSETKEAHAQRQEASHADASARRAFIQKSLESLDAIRIYPLTGKARGEQAAKFGDVYDAFYSIAAAIARSSVGDTEPVSEVV